MHEMDAKQLADKFTAKIAAATAEHARQSAELNENAETHHADADHCKRALAENVIPFLTELQTHLPDKQFTFATQIDLHDHKVVGVSFKIGDGPTTTISTAFGNVAVTHTGHSGTTRGTSFVYPPDAEPYIANSGDLTREKTAKLVEMVMDNEL
jgi:hypothetical protein